MTRRRLTMGEDSQTKAPERKDEVLETELPESLIVYDLTRDQGHCLNPIAAFVWKHCDGKTPVSEIARVVEEKYNVRGGKDIVLFILDQLKKKWLLKEGVAPIALSPPIPRRDIVMKYIPAALVLPFIISAAAPTWAQLASGTPAPPGEAPAPPEDLQGGVAEVRIGGVGTPYFIFSGSASSLLIICGARRKRRKKPLPPEEVTKDNPDVLWHIEGTHDANLPITYGIVPRGMTAVISAETLIEGELYFVQSKVDTATATSTVIQYFRIENGQVVEIHGDQISEE